MIRALTTLGFADLALNAALAAALIAHYFHETRSHA